MGRGYAYLSNDGTTIEIFVFNHIIAKFGIPKMIVIDNGSHFQNNMLMELASKLGFWHEN